MRYSQVDIGEATGRQRRVWSAGDYGRIGVRLTAVSERLVEALDIWPGERVLDVAGGAGNTALAAARRGAWVVCTDFVPDLLDQSALRAAAEGLPIETFVADAQCLPFEPASFDVVTSTFGVIFAPDQETAAAELVRVARPGGRIGLATWAPDGVMAAQFAVTESYAEPPPSLGSQMIWGNEEGLRDLFGADVAEIRVERRSVEVTAHSYDDLFERYRASFGPVATAYARLDPEAAAEYAEAWKQAWRPFNRSGDGCVVATVGYLQAIAVTLS